jgi:RNase P subunit RPR2
MIHTRHIKLPAGPLHHPWRCEKCRTLLGTDSGAEMRLRYKDSDYLVTGKSYSVVGYCRNCGTANRRNRQDAPE